VIPAITTITEPREFATLRAEWDPLVAAMPRPSPFLLHGWLLQWWRHHSRHGRLSVHVAREGDRLTGALPLFVERRRGLRIARFLGKDAAALADVLVADGAHPSTAGLLVERAAGSGADFVDLFGLPESSRLEAAAGSERLRLIQRAEAPVLDLRAGWDEVYRAKTSAKRRNLHRRRRKQLSRLGDVTFDVARDLEELMPALEDAFRLHEARWLDRPEASGFATAAGQEFHRAAIAALAPLGVPRIALLRIDGEAVACNYFFLYRECMYFHELAFDPLLARWSPGQIATLDSIEVAAAEGARRVEFLGGAERYKLELADGLEPLHQGLGLVATLRGRAALAARTRAVHARRRLKETPVRRLYYDGLAPARRMARLANNSTSPQRGTSAPGGSPDRMP
jgi:CelD/BcsL family acetyltransferase involved in cellulose biosynthesis